MPVAPGGMQVVQVKASQILAVDGQAGAVEDLQRLDAPDQPAGTRLIAGFQQVVGINIFPLFALLALEHIEESGRHDAQ